MLLSAIVANAQDGAVPPGREPILPASMTNNETTPTNFGDHYREVACQYGAGLSDPQWVTVFDCRTTGCYRRVEGTVKGSGISFKDDPQNHDSNDHNTSIYPDSLDRFILSTVPEESDDPLLFRLELERKHFPEKMWPSPGNRISAFGYWIFDCGHDYYTEIHPIVGIAVHRPAAVSIPAGHLFPYVSESGAVIRSTVGENVVVPGIVTDLWFSADSGEITRNCSWSGLHQPAHEGPLGIIEPKCIRGPAPLGTRFEFNIYLPPDPQILARRAGLDPAAVPLYAEVQSPFVLAGAGQPGPDPTITVVREEDVTFLKVSIDLAGYSEKVYTRRIVSAWIYASPDNWDARQWRLRMNAINVSDDGDGWFNDGDWSFWLNTNNGYQEWSRIFDCDGCVHDTEKFNPPWETGPDKIDFDLVRAMGEVDAFHRLGPNHILFPDDKISFRLSGYESDTIWDDDTGSVDLNFTPEVGSHSASSHCRATGILHNCCDYSLTFELEGGDLVPAPVLSPAAKALYESYLRP